LDLFELIDHISKPFTSSDDDIYGPSEIAEKVEIRFLDNVDIPLYYWSNEIDASERVACLRSFLKIDPNIRGDVESFLYFHYQHDISEACYSDFKDAEDYIGWQLNTTKPFEMNGGRAPTQKEHVWAFLTPMHMEIVLHDGVPSVVLKYRPIWSPDTEMEIIFKKGTEFRPSDYYLSQQGEYSQQKAASHRPTSFFASVAYSYWPLRSDPADI
jgi:hypothetical protein